MKKTLTLVLALGSLALQASTLDECVAAYGAGALDKAQILCTQATKENPKSFDANYWLCETYIRSREYKKALPYAQKLEPLASSLDDYFFAYNKLGSIYSYLGDTNQELKYTQKSLEVTKKLGNKEQIGSVLHNLAVYYRNIHNLDEAKKYLLEALEYKTNKSSISNTYNVLAIIYDSQGDTKKAMESSQKAVDFAKEASNFAEYAHNSVTLAVRYINQANYEKAKTIFLDALKIAQDNGLKSKESYALYWLGVLSQRQGDKKSAKQYFTQALEIAKASGDASQVEDIQYSLNSL
ncbi:tetratricopeptide repeat protein [Sulfurimonas sp.]|uniref:tetratricopeptide repeat protein n=1 Tax=Sulfurimonas sp. TaxID=2022749 RepID=UPI0025F58784|nr:tetratricopeptide repeat protein [Sulfurimonas sp.]MBW6489156.1 tetratricopeptide repeat protein [Sulfurimonas sp.]